MTSREISSIVDLCEPDGVVAARAIGWSRRALHRCRVDGPWGRRKRWHHWCVTSSREVVALTFADLDYLGLLVALAFDRETGAAVRDVSVRPLGWGAALPESADRGRVEVAHRRARLALLDRGDRIGLVARTRRIGVDVEVARPPGHDTLGVAVAWPGRGGRRFAYSSKQTGLPATGSLTLDGEPRRLAPGALACLDWGRGVWPARTAWNWASAAGGGVGLNLGARWTDGGGADENAVLVDGRLRKLEGGATFTFDPRDPRRPWRITGPEVDLEVTPEHVERAGLPGRLGLAIAFGSFRGVAGGVAIRDLFGWAEELRILW